MNFSKKLITHTADSSRRACVNAKRIVSRHSPNSWRKSRIILSSLTNSRIIFNNMPHHSNTNERDNCVKNHDIRQMTRREFCGSYDGIQRQCHQTNANRQHEIEISIHNFRRSFVFLKKESGLELGFSFTEDKEYQIHPQNADEKARKSYVAAICEYICQDRNDERKRLRRYLQDVIGLAVLKKLYIGANYLRHCLVIPVFSYYFTISQTNKKGEIHV